MRHLAVLLSTLLLSACTGGGTAGPEPRGDDVPTGPAATTGTPAATTTADGLAGPLCPVLPKGEEPGNPTSLRDLDAAEALTWIPVATIVEALGRATGVDADLAAATDVTVLVPSDDTMSTTFNEATIDALILQRHDDARALLEAHVVPGARTLADLVDAGTVTTLAGTTISVTATADGLARFDDAADVLCGNYVTRSGTIHLIDSVLGPLPAQEEDADDGHG